MLCFCSCIGFVFVGHLLWFAFVLLFGFGVICLLGFALFLFFLFDLVSLCWWVLGT